MRQLECRAASMDDIPALAALRGVDEPGGTSTARMVAYIEGRHHPQRAKAPRGLWCAILVDSTPRTVVSPPIGYIAGHLTSRFGCDGEMQWLYVASAHRREGVASALLRHLARWFAAQGAQRVCVNVGDDLAHRFYAARGARPLRPHWLVWDDVTRLAATE